MSTKTITIDIEAYERLKAVRRENESFSKMIKRVIKTPIDIKSVEKLFRTNSLSDKAIKAIEDHVRQRHVPSRRKR